MQTGNSLEDTAKPFFSEGLSSLPQGQTSCCSRPRGARAEKGGPDLLQLPRAHVVRIVKSVLPANVRLNSAAATALNRCSAVFLLALADASSAACSGKRKTIAPSDVLAGLRSLGFDSIADDIEERMQSETDREGDVAGPAVCRAQSQVDVGSGIPAEENTMRQDQGDPHVEGERPEEDKSLAGEGASSGGEGEREVEAGDELEALMEVVDDVLAEQESQVADAQPDPCLF